MLQRHAEVYGQEFGYSDVFEDYVAASIAPFVERHDARKDAFWVAELDGKRVGCVAVQHDKQRPGWAKLRWFLVEQAARGHGVGHALLDQALAFVRQAGYAGILLWTVDDLVAARRLYERAGFRLAFTDPTPCPWAPWGHEQRWELPLGAA